MLNKTAIREYFIQKTLSSTMPQNIIEKLEKLSVFTDDKKQLNMNIFWNDLFNNVISMDLVNRVGFYIEQKQHLDDLDTIVVIQIWAKNAWKKGIDMVDINKIIISYILTDFLFLFPDNDLDWNFDEKIKEKLRIYLKNLPKILTFDISTNIPESASFSDKKFLSDYKTALEKNDHRGIFIFFTALAHGDGFHNQFNYFIEVLAKLSVIIDPEIFAENLSKFSPYLVRYFLEYLNPMQIADVLIVYKASEPLPLLVGIIQIIDSYDNNKFDGRLVDDEELIEKASLILEKIASIINTDNIYNYINNCSNIDTNKLWHCIFSAFIAKNLKYHNHYLDAINFSHNVGEYSFNTFIKYSDDDVLDNLSCKIYDRYFSSIIGKHSNRFIIFTSFLQYISKAIYKLSDKSHQKYLEKLEQVSIELKRGIYSWKIEEWNMLFTKWIFWLLSSKDFIERVSVNRDALKTTYELICDIRITDTLMMDSTSLINLLENPGRTGKITLPVAGLYDNEETTISWDMPIFNSDAPIK